MAAGAIATPAAAPTRHVLERLHLLVPHQNFPIGRMASQSGGPFKQKGLEA